MPAPPLEAAPDQGHESTLSPFWVWFQFAVDAGDKGRPNGRVQAAGDIPECGFSLERLGRVARRAAGPVHGGSQPAADESAG